MANEQGFTHLNVPLEVALNPKLTKTDVIVFWIIHGIIGAGKECFASNEWFAEKTGVAETSVARSVTKLEKLCYIKRTKFTGRKRYVTIDESYKQKYGYLRIGYNNSLRRNAKADFAETRRQTSQKTQTYNNRLLLKDRNTISLLRKDSVAEATKTTSSNSPTRLKIRKYKRRNGSVVDNSKCDQLIEYWNSKPLLTAHKIGGTGIYNKIVHELGKKLKTKSPTEIEVRIDKYHELVEISETGALKYNKKTPGFVVGLKDFLNPDDRHYRGKFNLKGDCWFEECSKSSAVLLKTHQRELQDKCPIYTKYIKEGWVNSQFYNSRHGLTKQDEDNFIRSAIKLSGFLTTHHDKIPLLKRRASPEKVKTGKHVAYKWVPSLFRSISSNNRNIKHTGHLAQDFVFDDFKKYLVNNELMKR